MNNGAKKHEKHIQKPITNFDVKKGTPRCVFLVPRVFTDPTQVPPGFHLGSTGVPPGCSGDGLASIGEGLGGIW